MTSPASGGALRLPSVDQVRLLGRAVGARRSGPAMIAAPARSVRRALPASLRVSILVPRTDVGGGARILFEHANHLSGRGHQVTVLSHLPAPEWFPLRTAFVEVPVGLRLVDLLPVSDLVVCGYWDMLEEASSAHLAPVLHLEQGDFHLFEEFAEPVRTMVHANLRAAEAHVAVSGAVASILLDRYGVSSTVVPNAVDSSVFRPAVRSATARRSVLAVGWDGNTFKGIDDVRAVATRLRRSHPDVEVVWVTPRPPVGAAGDVARVVVAPAQTDLADLYRSATAFVCASHYESFGLPGMEAMASGTPVVTTANPGALEYSRHEENALVVAVHDPTALHAALARVLDDADLASRLREGGLATSAGRAWEAVAEQMEAACREVAERFAAPVEDSGWTRSGSATPCAVDGGGAARLATARRRSSAARLLVPVRRPAFEGHDVLRWEVVATRADGEGECRVHAPHRAPEPPEQLPYQEGFDLFRAERFAEALERFRRATSQAVDPSVRGALPRWTALCLLELGRPEEAFAALAQALAEFPDNPDLYYLLGVVAAHLGHHVDFSDVADAVRVTGAGSRYLECFAHPVGIFADGLDATGSAERSSEPVGAVR